MRTIFKVFIEFASILFRFCVLAPWPRGMWEPSSPSRAGTVSRARECRILTAGLSEKSPAAAALVLLVFISHYDCDNVLSIVPCASQEELVARLSYKISSLHLLI